MRSSIPPRPRVQLSFASSEYHSKKKVTRRELFLVQMEQVVPWAMLVELIEPHYPKSGRVGRPPIGVERMLRMYFLQQWFALADEALEDAIYDSQSMREFVGIDLSTEGVPDATTLLKFRRLLQEHGLGKQMLDGINAQLEQQGLLMRAGTLVDATIIAAPSSTKNQDKARDPEMRSTKKNNQWHFGMKAHTGVDMQSGLVHSLHTTAANESDVAHAHEVLHGQEETVGTDAGYIGVDKRREITDKQAQGMLRKDIKWLVAQKRSKVKSIASELLRDLTQQSEKIGAQIRAKVEHPYHIVKNLFGHRKVRYRGLAKNTEQLYSLFALANLVIVKKQLLAFKAQGAS
ncbi:IS5 family transposase [Pectobacterium cacticida]|uniref:IS5 family transposase n=1 Tax=Pectobacterium cacticida TaxID=69221 RepID=UPI0039877DB4